MTAFALSVAADPDVLAQELQRDSRKMDVKDRAARFIAIETPHFFIRFVCS
jgi:hypothetical protein